MPAWRRRSIAGMLLIVAMLAAPLVLQGIEKSRAGQNRPYSYPASVPVRDAVQTFATQQPGMEGVFIARNGIEPGAFITIVLAAAEPVPVGFRRELRNVVREELGLGLLQGMVSGEEPVVRVYIIQQAPSAPAGA